MAIHPEYAEAILDGRKQVEFRKRPLASDVTLVVVYATAPVKKIVGEFRVAGHTIAHPSKVWARLHSIGEIDRSAFDAYYADADRAVAIMVGAASRYRRPIGLAELSPAPPPPQSFYYIQSHLLDQLHGWQTADRSCLGRVLASGWDVGRALVSQFMPPRTISVQRGELKASETMAETTAPTTGRG